MSSQLTNTEELSHADSELSCQQAKNFEPFPSDQQGSSLIHRVVRMLSRAKGSQLNRNMGAGSLMALAASCLSFISYPVYLHFLGYHTYGLWLVLSVVVSVSQLGNLGIPWALTKLVAEEYGRQDWEGVRAYIIVGCGIILGVGLSFIAVVTIARHSILHAFKLTGSDGVAVYSMLPWVAALSVLVLFFSTFNATLGGLGRMDLCSYNETTVQMLTIVMSGTLLSLGLRLWAMLLGALICYLVGQVISFVHVRRILPVPLFARVNLTRARMGRLLGTGGWILGGGICTTLLLPVSRLMLSRYAGLEAVALNDLCVVGSMRVRNIFDAAFRPMMPAVSTYCGDNAPVHDRLRSINRKALRITFFAALPFFATLFVVANPLLHLWLRKSFNPMLPTPFRIALLGAFLSLVGSSAYYVLIGFGSARDSAYSAAIQLAANALVLIGIAATRGVLTVEESTAAIAVATTSSTIYLRARMYCLARRPNVPEIGSVSGIFNTE